MLDFVNYPTQAQTVTRFSPRHPMQISLRKLLASLSEDRLAAVESDLEYYQRQGVMPARLETLLFGTTTALAA